MAPRTRPRLTSAMSRGSTKKTEGKLEESLDANDARSLRSSKTTRHTAVAYTGSCNTQLRLLYVCSSESCNHSRLCRCSGKEHSAAKPRACVREAVKLEHDVVKVLTSHATAKVYNNLHTWPTQHNADDPLTNRSERDQHLDCRSEKGHLGQISRTQQSRMTNQCERDVEVPITITNDNTTQH